MTRLSALSLLLLTLLLTSCESPYGHATVHWRRDLPQSASHLGSPAGPAVAEPPTLPRSYSGFAYLPSYPKTLSTWKDEALLQSPGPRRVVIDLTTQRGLFFVNGQIAMDFPVCTGTPDKPTPRGSFTITQKNKNHRSNLYHVPMPYFMRLTNDGIGLHVGKVNRKPSSHGCIRVPNAPCQLLFRQVSLGTPVDIR